MSNMSETKGCKRKSPQKDLFPLQYKNILTKNKLCNAVNWFYLFLSVQE